MHPPHSTQFAPSDCHLFLSTANTGEEFAAKEAGDNHLFYHFTHSEKSFYEMIYDLVSVHHTIDEQWFLMELYLSDLVTDAQSIPN